MAEPTPEEVKAFKERYAAWEAAKKAGKDPGPLTLLDGVTQIPADGEYIIVRDDEIQGIVEG
ncbi:hypothetical protein [Kitasatospora sp. SUK 42]|uniref:hypothetical protein n=1 Tax=Kitasatospora sp. SUK 42 TaxID=1588882 RepID=UPI001C31A832|nr:hypothetical protein [Kitasatospora sp. SUK 42]MBV2156805.1 hypothetical protein [Kitasatospora sp. SUK 42]